MKGREKEERWIFLLVWIQIGGECELVKIMMFGLKRRWDMRGRKCCFIIIVLTFLPLPSISLKFRGNRN